MPGGRRDRVSQRARGGRDVNVAGRDQVVITAGDHAVVTVGDAGTDGPGVPSLLPRDVPGFTGRDGELARLARLAGGGRVVVAAISGTAGVGKTALAVHAAHQLLPQFPDGQLYADLRGYTEGQDPAGPGEMLQVFLRRLSFPAKEIPAEVEERSGLLRQILAGRRVLMVLDNARSEAQVRPLLPGAGGSLVLVTSRSVLPGLEADERVSLDILPGDEAVAMLAEMIGAARADAEPQAVAEVARLCGRLPLALRIAGQLLSVRPAWTASRLAQMLTGEQDRLARLGAGDLQARAAFEVSYRQLAEEDARLFRLLGLHPGPDFGDDSAAALAGTTVEEAGPVLDRLAEAHLVTEDVGGQYGMHDLLRLYARATCQQTDSPADRDAAEERLVAYYTGLARALDACVNPGQRPAEEQPGETLWTMREALAVFQAQRPGLLAALGLAAQHGWDLPVQGLSYWTARSLLVLRYLDDLVTVYEAALAVARRDGDRAAEGMALGNLGGAYAELRRFTEAIDCNQQSLTIFRETGDRHSESMALGHLGEAYRNLRRFAEAIDCFQQDIAICRETGDRHGEGTALGGLGEAYRNLRRFAEAIDCFQQDIAICRETGDRHSEGPTLNRLGEAYRELRRFEDAIECFQQSLAIFWETGNRYREGEVLNNLGNAYLDLQRSKEAIDCFQQSLAIFRETGDRHSEGMTLTNLGAAYRQRRRLKEAVDCHQQFLAICRETGDRYNEGKALGNLGNAYRDLRRFKEAIDCYQQDIAICQETGNRHGEGLCLSNVGVACYRLRQLDLAAESFREAAAAMRDAGDYERAALLDQLVVRIQTRWRPWRRRASRMPQTGT
jgi:tetratricopeptide (TPR) repeat protein